MQWECPYTMDKHAWYSDSSLVFGYAPKTAHENCWDVHRCPSHCWAAAEARIYLGNAVDTSALGTNRLRKSPWTCDRAHRPVVGFILLAESYVKSACLHPLLADCTNISMFYVQVVSLFLEIVSMNLTPSIDHCEPYGQ